MTEGQIAGAATVALLGGLTAGASYLVLSPPPPTSHALSEATPARIGTSEPLDRSLKHVFDGCGSYCAFPVDKPKPKTKRSSRVKVVYVSRSSRRRVARNTNVCRTYRVKGYTYVNYRGTVVTVNPYTRSTC